MNNLSHFRQNYSITIMWWKMKTWLTRNNIIKYWKLSIDMCQYSSANDECDESDGITGLNVNGFKKQ